MRNERVLWTFFFRIVFLWIASASVFAQVSLKFDINDLKSHEHEAAYTTGQGTKTIVWTTSELPEPSVEKHSDFLRSHPRLHGRSHLLSHLRRRRNVSMTLLHPAS